MFVLIKNALSMRRTQSVATFLSVALASAVVLALALSFMGVRTGLERSKERLGADLMVIPVSASIDVDETVLLFTGAPVNMYMDASIADRIRSCEGVAAVTEQFYGQTLNKSCCSASTPARLIGIDPQTDWIVSPWTKGESFEGLAFDEIVIGSDLAGDFPDGTGSVLGRNVRVVQVLEESGTDLDGSILMNIEEVRSLVAETDDLAYLWGKYGNPSSLVSCVMVDVEEGARDAVVSQLASIEGVSVVEGSQTVERVASQMGSLFSIMAGAAVLLVVATLFQLYARFFSLAWDRRSELALYRALGASKKEVSLLIGGEAAVLVGGGLVCGFVLGAILYCAVPNLLAGAGSFPFVGPGLVACVLTGLLVALAFCLIGAAAVAYPISRVGKIDPSSAMQTGDID